jgi:hypothetical protein
MRTVLSAAGVIALLAITSAEARFATTCAAMKIAIGDNLHLSGSKLPAPNNYVLAYARPDGTLARFAFSPEERIEGTLLCGPDDAFIYASLLLRRVDPPAEQAAMIARVKQIAGATACSLGAPPSFAACARAVNKSLDAAIRDLPKRGKLRESGMSEISTPWGAHISASVASGDILFSLGTD